MLAPAGQLALPASCAQLGLDGVAYAPASSSDSSSDRSPEGASPYLGNRTGFCNPAELPTNPSQLALDLDAWEKAKQLTMWQRLEVQREVLSFTEWDRYAKCGWVRFKRDIDVGVKRRESGSYSACNVIRCGYPGCPWCGTTLAQQRASELGACIEKHLDNTDGDTDVWMLTLTVPHSAIDSASVVVEQVYAAQAMLVRSREWREFRAQWGLLTNGARHLDAVMGGADGLHAHFHTALFATRAGLPTSEAWRLGLDEKANAREWLIAHDSAERFWATTIAADDTDDVRALPADLATQLRQFGIWRKLKHCTPRVREKYLDQIAAPLVVAWERCCDAVGVRITNREQFRRRALKLTPGEDAAAYYVGWMLADEVTRSVAKDRNPVRLLDAIKAGIKGAAYTYKQFRRAVDGRQWVSGLTDLRRVLEVSDEDVKKHADERRRKREAQLEREGNPVQRKRELDLVVRSHLFAGVHNARYRRDGEATDATGWDAVFAFIDDTEAKLTSDTLPSLETLQRALDDFLWTQLPVAHDSRSAWDEPRET